MSTTVVALWAIIASLVGLAGTEAVTTDHNASPAKTVVVEPVKGSPLTCLVENDGGRIVAYVTSSSAQSGSFDFTVESRGDNTIKTRQSGDFNVGAGETQKLRTVRLGGDLGHVTGQLSLTWDHNKHTSCDLA